MKKISIFTAILLTSMLAIFQISYPLADFNGDRISELAIGVPGEDPWYYGDDTAWAGAFDVMYGVLGSGLDDYGEQFLYQGMYGVYGVPELYDGMGKALAIGDYNGDGNYDLAVTVYFETIGTVHAAGGVQIFYGDGNALETDTDHMIHQDTAGVPGGNEENDYFGYTLAAGNFNHDAYDDLAVGVPFEDSGTIIDSGDVTILFGSAAGLTGTGSLMLRQGYDGLPDTEEQDDRFGSSLAVGDFDSDGYDDLAIGVPNEDLERPAYPYDVASAGVVHVVYGDHLGPPVVGDDLLYEDSATFDLCENSDPEDRFGLSLATGKFNNGVFDDLVIGVEKSLEGGTTVYGGIHVVFGGLDGLKDSGDQCWNVADMGLNMIADDDFATSMGSCDFNGDGNTDLAISAIGDSDAVTHAHGSVAVMYGGPIGIYPSTTELFQQGLNGLQGKREDVDQFGYALQGGNFNGDSYCDLAVGVPFEDVGSPAVPDAGVVQILFGSQDGITTHDNQLWYQGYNGLQNSPGNYDHFGEALASIPFYNDQIYIPLTRR